MDNICIAVDSACDLTPEFIRNNDIKILPISVIFDTHIFRDNRDPKMTLDFYDYYADHKDDDVHTEPLTVNEVSAILEEELLHHYDGVQVITISSSRSKIFDNTREAALIKLPKLKALHRDIAGRSAFRMRVFDSTSMFTGQAVMVREAVRLLREEKLGIDELDTHLTKLAEELHAYVIPRDLYYLHTRARQKGDNSVGWMSYKLGNLLNVKPVVQCYRGETEPVFKAAGFDSALEKLFDRVREAMAIGLSTPFIAMSYGGNLDEIRAHPLYSRFVEDLESHGIEVMLSLMSTTAAVNIGPEAFSLAYAVNTD